MMAEWTGFHGESSKRVALDNFQTLRVWKCLTDGCDNAICTWATESLCFPCCEAEVGIEEMARRFNATHREG